MIDNIEILAKSSYIIAAIFGSAYTHQWKEAIMISYYSFGSFQIILEAFKLGSRRTPKTFLFKWLYIIISFVTGNFLGFSLGQFSAILTIHERISAVITCFIPIILERIHILISIKNAKQILFNNDKLIEESFKIDPIKLTARCPYFALLFLVILF